MLSPLKKVALNSGSPFQLSNLFCCLSVSKITFNLCRIDAKVPLIVSLSPSVILIDFIK